jgi:hypothetical protein
MGGAASVASPTGKEEKEKIHKLSPEKTEKLILDTLSYEDVRHFFKRGEQLHGSPNTHGITSECGVKR